MRWEIIASIGLCLSLTSPGLHPCRSPTGLGLSTHPSHSLSGACSVQG